MSRVVMIFAFTVFANSTANAAETLDRTPRTAVVSAFEPEQSVLQKALRKHRTYVVNGITFETGSIEGKPVVLFLSGISMVNAAITSQLALDHFTITRIVFSGVAGGADPKLAIGDIVAPEQWSEYLESVLAREENGSYLLPGFADKSLANFGMLFPQPVEVVSGTQEPEKRLWFPADAELLAIAKAVSDLARLNRCTANNRCLQLQPKIIVGGNGVSGQSFVDNAAFRKYAHNTFNAKVLDMESAAVAHVAYVNKTPFIAFRSLSDLAGGDAGGNKFTEEAFRQLASYNAATVVKAFLKALP